MRTVPSTDGVHLAVHDLGGSGPDVLLSHATGFHGMVWAPMAAVLASSYHCWSFDYRAHGVSTVPAGGLRDWLGFGEDAAAVVAGLGLERPFAVGHSMGGAALLMAEVRRPGTFRGLVLYEPIVFPPEGIRPPGGGNPLAAGARKRRSTFASKQAAFDNYASKPPLNVFTDEALWAYVDHGFAEGDDGSVHLRCQPEHEAATFELSPAHDTWGRLGEVSCPVLVLAGRIEHHQPSAIAGLVAHAIPGAHYREFEPLGHFGPMEDPELVAEVVDEFFAAL